jgi:cation:H+ antiporter
LLHVSQAAIGLTVVAVGTSLPELATTIVACIKRHGDIAIGNVIGSNIFNILGVLGVTALFHPLEAGEISWLDLGLMAGLAGLLGIVLFNRLTLNRKHGVIFLVVFVAYTVWTQS